MLTPSPQDFDAALIAVVRKSMPNLMAYDICGVRPMSGRTGIVFGMKTVKPHLQNTGWIDNDELGVTLEPISTGPKHYKKIYP